MVGGGVGCGPGVRTSPGVKEPGACGAGAVGGAALPLHDTVSDVATMTTVMTTCHPNPRLIGSHRSRALASAPSAWASIPTSWWSRSGAAAAVPRPALGARR